MLSGSGASLIRDLLERNVQLWVDNDRIRFRAPKGRLDEALRERLRQHRTELVSWIGPGRKLLVLSSAQRRLWFVDQLGPRDPSYNLPFALEIEGRLHPATVARALRWVTERHEALRTTFGEIDGYPYQVVHERSAASLKTVELERLPLARRREEALRQIRYDARRPFEIGRSVGRFTLFRIAADRHLFALNLHHIAADAHSFEILRNDFAQLCASIAGRGKATLPPPELSHSDATVVQREDRSLEREQASLAYWRRQLEGAVASVLDLDRRAPKDAIRTGRRVPLRVSAQSWQRVSRLGEGAGCTPFMTLLCVFVALLQRYSRTDDICVGSPVGRRDRRDLAGVVGFFVDEIVLRVDTSGRPSFVKLLERVRDVCVDALAHSNVPFETLVAELNPDRTEGSHPLFQVSLTFQSLNFAPITLGGLRWVPLALDFHRAHFDLELLVWISGGELRGYFLFDVDVFEEAMMRRVTTHFENLVGQCAERPHDSVASIEILTPVERHLLLSEWNDSAVELAGEREVHRQIEDRAARVPDAVAVVSGTEQWTYRELDRFADRLARRLLAAGVGADSLVMVSLRRSFDLVIALLAVLKAGGAYVPVDPDEPRGRRQRILDHCRPVAILSRTGDLDLELGACPVMWLDEAWEDASRPVDGHPHERNAADALAYVLFTSGSTGEPKGVAISRHALANHMDWMARALPLTSADRVLQKTSTSFDASVWEFWAPLMAGAVLVLADDDVPRNTERLLEELIEHRITVLQVVPALLRTILQEPRLRSCRQLRRVLCGGDALASELRDAFDETLADSTLVNVYGPTEATIHASSSTVSGSCRRPSIGRPIDNVRLYVLDQNGALRPPGVPGELFISGASLARGYLRDARRTAQSFIPDPFSGGSGSRLYATGDRARYRSDGRLEFMGRLDRQVKLLGHRIELEGVEALLRAHPDVADCTVLLEDGAATPKLEAFVVLRAEAPGASGGHELRGHLARELPTAAIPSRFAFLDAIPRTASGKTDRQALRRGDHAKPAEPRGAGRPGTDVERELAAIWENLLGIEDVGADDDFFAIGGHSLVATRVVASIRESYSIALPLREIFEHSTLRRLARRVEEMARGVPSVLAQELSPVARDLELPLSFAQQRLWFLEQLRPGSSAYVVPYAYRVTGGRLDVRALEKALETIVHRHEIFRTSFASTDGIPRQRIAEPQPFRVRLVDLTSLSTGVIGQEIAKLVDREGRMTFDLSRGPLLRATVIRASDDDHALLLTWHHIVTDEWSSRLFFDELDRHYATAANGSVPSSAPPRLQYADYAVWQRSRLRGSLYAKLARFWKRELSGSTVAAIAPDPERGGSCEPRSARRASHILSSEATQAVRSLATSIGATQFMVLLAALYVVLHRATGSVDLVVGTPVANRSARGSEKLLGFLANNLVLRCELSPQMHFRDLVELVRHRSLRAFSHEELPFDLVVEELRAERAGMRTPLFQVQFVWREAPAREPRFEGLSFERVHSEPADPRFDLEWHVEGRESGLEVHAVYDSSLYHHATIVQMVHSYANVIEAVARVPDQPIHALATPPVVTAKRAPVFQTDSRQVVGGDDNVMDWFHDAARANPDRTAMTMGELKLTFAQLESRVARLARSLAVEGVGRGAVAGLYMRRSIDAIVVVLAIMETGAACLPLDPDYPYERLRLMLETASPRLVVTTNREPFLAAGTTILPLEELEQASSSSIDPTHERSFLSGDELAYIIFTSGSTGVPKGVQFTHRALANLIAWHSVSSARGRVLQFAPLSFDASFSEIFTALVSGSTLVLANDDTKRDPKELVALLAAESITKMILPVVMFHQIAEVVSVRRQPLPALKEIIVTGERLSLNDASISMLEQLPGVVLDNHYGPSETHVVTTWRRDGAWHECPRYPPLGGTIPNAQVHVLRPDLTPVSAGETGEIHIGGAALARGYLGRPGWTAAKFIPDPFSPLPGGRLYRSGDLGRFARSGELEFVGRADDQVKLRGFRVELGEVESALERHTSVIEAAVAATRDETGRVNGLVACVVSDDDNLTESRLRDFVGRALPEFMIPGRIVPVDALPTTPSGKVDRGSLAQLVIGTNEISHVVALPRGSTEKAVLDIWKDVLRRRIVSVSDNFFEIGGHSLLASQVTSRVEATFEIELPLKELFEHPTIRDLSSIIDRKEARHRSGIGRVPRTRALPLSYAQERMWRKQRMEPRQLEDNLYRLFDLEGPLDLQAMRASYRQLVQRHEILRTTFPTDLNGEPVLEIADEPLEKMLLVDLRSLASGDRLDTALWWAEELASTPFALETDSPVRLALFQIDDDRHVLLLSVHHVVSDGWSHAVFCRDLSQLYRASQGLASTLRPLELQYADFAAWQRSRPPAERRRLERYWRDVLAPPLPRERRRESQPNEGARRGRQERFTLSREVTNALTTIQAAHAITLPTALLAALNAVLARTSADREVIVLAVFSGRDRVDLEPVMGPFFNILPIRTAVDGDPSFVELIGRTHEMMVGAHDHQAMPFEEILALLASGGSPVQLDVLFNVQNMPETTLDLPGLRATSLSLSRIEEIVGAARGRRRAGAWTTEVSFVEIDGTLDGRWGYDSSGADAAAVRARVEEFQLLVERAIEHPDTRLSQLLSDQNAIDLEV